MPFKSAIFAFLICSFVCTSISAQSPVIRTVAPLNQHTNFGSSEKIIIQLQQPVKKINVKNSITIRGEISGVHDYAFELSRNNRTIELQPRTSLKRLIAGEKVDVHIAASLHPKMSLGYSWQFTVATAPSSLELSKGEQFSLKRNGEQHLNTVGAHAADLNNDNYSDLTLVNQASQDLRMILNDGVGGFNSSMEVIPMQRESAGPTKGTDFNKDGDFDLAVYNDHNHLLFFMGDGTGSVFTSKKYESGLPTFDMTIIDFDADGNEDIAAANGDRITIYKNDGTGNFSNTQFDPKGNGEACIATADCNNDGILDLIVGFDQSNEIGILLGDGSGNFSKQQKVKVNGSPAALAIGDLNGDGNADVVSANAKGDIVMVLLGDGAGGISQATPYALPAAKSPSAIKLGDLDGDGDLDMVTSNVDSRNFVIWENNASGVMSKVDMLNISGAAGSFLLHDRDLDGDLDLTGIDVSNDVIHTYNNDQLNPEQLQSLGKEILVSVGPNPFRDRLQIKIDIPLTGRTDVRIINSNGQTLERLWDDRLTAGQHYFGWDGGRHKGIHAPPGIYYVVVVQNGKQKSIPITKA